MTFGSFFAGIGGLDLGLERAGMVCRWQCEIEPYSLKVLAKHWPEVPRYGDIRQLTGDELAPVDLVCGGYPCQPFSQAGKRAGEDDPRHLWPELARLLRVLRPRYVLLENVPGHLSLGFGSVLGDLARLGFDAEWTCIRASDVGASHIRKRVFIVAHSNRESSDVHGRERTRVSLPTGSGATMADASDTRSAGRQDARADSGDEGADRRRSAESGRGSGHMEDSGRTEQWGATQSAELARRRSPSDDCRAGGTLADSGDGQLQEPRRRSEGRDGIGPTGPFAPGPADPRWPAILAEHPDLAPALESPLRGVAHGLPDYVDRALANRTKRLGRLGNAVVPQVAEWIGRRIMETARP